MPRYLISPALAVFALLLATRASAQPLVSSPTSVQADFHRIRARVGDVIYVTDPDRHVEISGRLASLTDQEITVDGHHFTPRPGLKIERRGDPIWDGALLGFLLGGLSGVTVGAEGCLHRSQAPCFMTSGILWGAVGAYWDWQHKGRTTVFVGGPKTAGVAADASAIAPVSPIRPTVFDFNALGLKRGDRVAVTAADGTRTTGVITAMSRDAFRVGAVDLSGTLPTQVERIGDPIWDGAAYGAGAGIMLSVAGESGLRTGVKTALILGSIGAALDAMMDGRTVLYGGDALGRSARLRLVPQIGAHEKGAALVVRF